MSNKLWIELVHEEYEARLERDTFTRDHYTGAAKDEAIKRASRLTDTLARHDDGTVTGKRDKNDVYLYRRAQGESVDAYQERVKISKFPRHHAAVVDSFSGSIFSVEHKADRTLEPFGEIEDPGSVAYKLWRDADGSGTNYTTMYKRAAGMFTNYLRVWYLVEDDRFTWLDSRHVRNWFYTDGVLSDVVVQEMVDGRADIKSEYGKEDERTRYIHYHRDGWDRYRITQDDKGSRKMEKLEDDSGEWEYAHYNDAERTEVTVPVGYVDLPIDSETGFRMAQEANYLYNLLSDPRNLMRVANHPKLAGDVDDDQFDNTAVSLQSGSNLLQGSWAYISPSAENMSLAYDIYRQEAEEFWVTSHQRYDNAAKEVTATEALQDEQRGRGAYLNLLSGALDELENRVLFLMAQKQFPTQPGLWLDASVKRSTDFAPVDMNAYTEMVSKRYFDGALPIGPTGQKNALRIITAADGIEIEDDEMEDNIDRQAIEGAQVAAADAELNELLNQV